MSLQTFINHYLRHPVIFSHAEERELFRQWRHEKNLEARQKIIESQIRLVLVIARKFTKAHPKNELQDLLQAGLLGLLLATEKFNPQRKTRFIYYAKQWIIREMQVTVRKNFRIAYLPVTTQREKVFAQTIRHKNEITDFDTLVETIIRDTRISREIVKEMVHAIFTSDVSLNQKISSNKHNILPEDNEELIDLLPSAVPSPEEARQEREISEIIRAALRTLKEGEERLILGKYFEEMSNKELSQALGRSIISMLNLELKIRKKLQKKLEILKPTP